MVRKRGFGGLAAVVCICACAVGTTGIRRDAKFDPRYAYLYGRFFMKADPRPGSMAGGLSMGLLIRCQNGAEYTLGGIATRDVQVLEVRPSRCWLIEAIMADENGIIRKRLRAEPPLQRPLDFTAGRAYYAGDYFGRAESWTTPELAASNLRVLQWAMDPADDRYESTTAEMRLAYPNLAPATTVDMRLIPAPERKRGNGIVAAAGEPPMSPERVARIAPFIKRNYSAPAECEAACPAGECLPYRGESGPAMACVIHCNKNGDCPDGLACNCAKPGGTDCRPIATTAQDAMARICLSVEAAGQRR